jgi:hypothetical protein
MADNHPDLARDIDYVVASSRGHLHECGTWVSSKEAAIRMAGDYAQRHRFPYDVYEVKRIGRSAPTDPLYTPIDSTP